MVKWLNTSKCRIICTFKWTIQVYNTTERSDSLFQGIGIRQISTFLIFLELHHCLCGSHSYCCINFYKFHRLLGEYRCTAAGQGPNALDYVTVDVVEKPIPDQSSHPYIHISVYRNGGAECVAPPGTKVQLVKLLVNPYEGAVLVDCFARVSS